MPHAFRYVGYVTLMAWAALFGYEIMNTVPNSETPFMRGDYSNLNSLFLINFMTYHLPVIGMALILISKDRVEDEFSLQVRFQAILLGLSATIIIAVLIMLYALVFSPFKIFFSKFGLVTTLILTLFFYYLLKWRASRYEK